MSKIAAFSAQDLQAACQILAETDRGLSGSQIEYLLADCKIPDVDKGNTKWKRLFNALAEVQNKHHVGNHLIMFINRALNPVTYSRNRADFEWRRDELNVVLAFSGYSVREDGKVVETPIETTIRGARARVGALRSKLEERCTHPMIFEYCTSELIDENYYHAVFEAIKGVAERIRLLTGLPFDGADLVGKSLSINNPIILINALENESQKSEQKGFSNILIGLFGSVRNPSAHSPRIAWSMDEQDALDIFSMISYIHRKLDGATVNRNNLD